MKLESQVVSLELAKKLKELGVKQDAEFSWLDTIDYDDTPRLCWTDDKRTPFELAQQTFEKKYSAFTVAELGELLQLDKAEWLVCSIEPNTKKFFIDYRKHIEKADTEAEARAKMLIYLIEKRLLSVTSEK